MDLQRQIEKLPSKHQELLRMKFQQNLSYEEIARITKMSVHDVSYAMHKAMSFLRQQAKGVDAPQ